MTRLLFYICFIITQFLSYTNVNAYKAGLLGQELFSSYASQIVPATAKVKEVEGKYIVIDLMDSLTLYKITTSLNFSKFDTISFEYYIENGKGQILLLQNNAEVIMHTVLDDLSTEKDKWISVTYKIPQCSDFDAIAIKNVDNLKVRFRSIVVTNTEKVDFITSKLANNVSSWSWGISDIENKDGYIHINEIGQWCALSVHYDKETYYHDYVEFETMQTDLMTSLSVATDNCGDYDYMLYEVTPEKNGDWYKYHIDFGQLIMPSCTINRFSFMNRVDKLQALSIKNLYTGTYPIDETLNVNNDKQYECDELLSMVGIFDSEEDLYWINLSDNVDHILTQPSRLVAYNIHPDGYVSFKSPKEFQSPVLLEMEVLSSYSHWTFELFDSSGNSLNKLNIDNDQFTMNKEWTTVKQLFEKETGKKDIMESFKIYHNSTKNENLIIRNLNFHPYNPPLESGINKYESCCEIKYCVCEVIYETIYIDEDEEIPTDDDIIYDFGMNEENNDNDDTNKDKENKEDVNENKEDINNNENKEDVNENKEGINNNENIENENESNDNKEGDIQKRSLLNRIGSFLNNLNI